MSLESSSQVQAFDWKTLLFSFEGRTRRSHFWIGWLIVQGLGFVLGLIPVVGILGLVLIWPNLAINVKRLHDMGKSGWLVVIPIVANIVGFIAVFATIGVQAIANSAALENEDPAAIIALIGPALGIGALLFVINVGFLLWIGLVDSQAGDNRFGPNPKAL